MSFLAPLFFAGLAAIAIPVIVHLIQRERKEVVQFPSLMFIRKIPYQSVERRRIHNWLLLALRAAAMALLVAAFTRPFFKVDPVKAAAASAGAREVVILLDHSASMGYGDHWDRAKAEASKVIGGLHGDDRATLVLFGSGIEENVRATSDQGRLQAAVREAKVTSDSTRYAPALREAQSLLTRSTLPRKEAVLISDFQRSGWARQEEIKLPEGATLTPVSVADVESSDLAVSSVALPRSSFATEERVTPTVGIVNHGAAPYTNVPVTFSIDGKEIGTRPVSLGPNQSASVTFPPFTIAESNMQGTIKAGTDKLAADNVFNFVLSPSRPVSVLIVQGEGGGNTSDFLATALAIGNAPPFKVDVLPVSRVTEQAIEHRSVIILNNATAVSTSLDDQLKRFVQQGGGLLVATDDHNPWGTAGSPLYPGTLGNTIDRMAGAGATLGFLDYSHPVFEDFKDPHQGNFSSVKFQRYRSIQAAPTDKVLAKFDDGATAMVERKVGSGRVIAFATGLDDDWSNFPKQPMFLPLVHELAIYLSQYDEPEAWYTVGRMLDANAPLAEIVREGSASAPGGAVRRPSGVVMSPAGEQSTLGEGGVQAIALAEQGFYSVRMQGTGERRPFEVAVNLDPAESDLTPLQPAEFVSQVTGRAAVTATGQSLERPDLTPADMEKKQSIWWFLLVAGAAVLLGESLLANRLSARFKRA
jgi:hypothetical protein